MEWYWWVLVVLTMITLFAWGILDIDKTAQPIHNEAIGLIDNIMSCNSRAAWAIWYKRGIQFELKYPEYKGCINAIKNALLAKASELAVNN